jgi:ABC-type nitrate/sulfonate/bicarbonate transport system permease component
VLSIAAALALWEIVSRTGLISQRDLPAMSTTFSELWSLVADERVLDRVRAHGARRAIGLALGDRARGADRDRARHGPITAAAFRVPIEFLRPIPSAALIPVLFLTLGTNLKSEVFLAAFGAFWPLLVQTMYGVRDVDPVAIETARSFGVGRFERLYRITLPSAVPYIATGLRISSTVSLILAFTAELFMGTPASGRTSTTRQSYGLEMQLYALALATGFLGVAIHIVFTRSSDARSAGIRRSGGGA